MEFFSKKITLSPMDNTRGKGTMRLLKKQKKAQTPYMQNAREQGNESKIKKIKEESPNLPHAKCKGAGQ